MVHSHRQPREDVRHGPLRERERPAVRQRGEPLGRGPQPGGENRPLRHRREAERRGTVLGTGLLRGSCLDGVLYRRRPRPVPAGRRRLQFHVRQPRSRRPAAACQGHHPQRHRRGGMDL